MDLTIIQNQILKLQQDMIALQSSSTFPKNIEMAIRTRLGFTNGFTGTITTAKLTGGGSNGSMTFSKGILISQVAAT